ncbi:MAG: glycosyltransferase [Candidatus Omnitrophica bacterium]|nr:glycosyltransferase [Candidatus Omnitrophota bacterium]
MIPAYNEEKRIRPSLEEVARFCSIFGRETEVLIVDDGSRDNTAHLVRDFIATHPEGARFELLHYDKNRGKGFAVAQGLRKSRGKFVAFSDTDLSAPIDQLPLLIQGLESGADIAIASRRLPASKVVGLPYSRQLMGKFFALLSRLLVLPGFSDTQCGFKAYRREIAYKLAGAKKSMDIPSMWNTFFWRAGCHCVWWRFLSPGFFRKAPRSTGSGIHSKCCEI